MQQATQAPSFRRKVLFSKWALVFERIWPKLWFLFAVAAVFALLSVLEIWPIMSVGLHKFVLAALAIAALIATVFAFRISWPTREEAIRRIERNSNVAHRPASSYEDTLSQPEVEEETTTVWHAHRQRLADMMSKLRVGNPQPGTHHFDPMALRLGVLLGVVMLAALVGGALPQQFATALDFESKLKHLNARIDAWVTPPSYTRKPPLMLADGITEAIGQNPDNSEVLQIPVNSSMIVRATGARHKEIALEITTDQPEPQRYVPKENDGDETDGAQASADTVSEIRLSLTKAGRMRMLRGGNEIGRWDFIIIPDEMPKISLMKGPSSTVRGSLNLNYKLEDDYGVASALVKFKKILTKEQTEGNPDTEWARKDILKGPRPPLEPPPVLTLRVPRAGIKLAEAKSTLEIGKHPWAGLTVMMVLEATDVAGQKGESLPFEFTLPQRRFDNPFARAIIEQRRKLVADWRYRDQVAQALDALTLEPDMFIDDTQVYLALRAMYYRLNRDRTREGRNSIIEQLWDTAVRIEDGGLSDAERRLRAAQDQLAKLLKEQASEEDVKQAMKELQKALENFMQQRQKQAEKNGENQPGKDKDSQVISQEDLERMMQEIEENIKNGTREEAQQMLSDLRDILDKMRSSQQADDQFKHNQEMKEKLDKLSEVIDDQKQLMDETFDRRRAKQSGQRSNSEMSQAQAQAGRQQGQNAGQRQGQRSQQSSGGQSNRRSGQRSRRGQSGQRPGQQQAMGQPSQQQQQGQPGQGSVDRLSQRQKALRRQLGGVQREFDELGHGRPDYLNRARRAMDNASEALQKDQLAEATRQQARALEQMRQSSQELVREMMENSPQQYGQGESESRDPLGRPQAFRGPNDGRSVKVPTQIDRQRAREILEELRKRIGELQRPDLELQYIERLLRRF